MSKTRTRTGKEKSPAREKPALVGRGQVLGLLVLLGVAGALWFGREHVGTVFAAFTGSDQTGNAGARQGARGVPVVVAKAGGRPNDVFIDAIATARAKRFVTLYPEVSGEIVQLDVQANQRVGSGDIIMRLDSRDAELAVELARVRVEEAELALRRSQLLMDRNVNSAAKVQDSRTVLERTRIELRQADEALSKRALRAPFAGVLGIAKVEQGDRVSPTTDIITVDDRSQLLVEIEVPEEYLAHIEPGQKVAARTPSFPGRRFEGTVEKIDSRVMPASRTVMVRATLPNPRDLLRPGMSFAVELSIPGKQYASVPELALQWAKGASYVWKVEGNAAVKIPVRSVKRLNRVILVEGEIHEGDIVVVEGVQRLRQGRKVSFTLPDPAPGA